MTDHLFPPRVQAFLAGLETDLSPAEWAAIATSPAAAAVRIEHVSATTVALRQLGLRELGVEVSDNVHVIGYPMMRLASNGHAGDLTPNLWATAELLAEWAALALLATPALDAEALAMLTAPFAPYFPIADTP